MFADVSGSVWWCTSAPLPSPREERSRGRHASQATPRTTSVGEPPSEPPISALHHPLSPPKPPSTSTPPSPSTMSQSSDDERQLPPSVEAASQMVYRSSGLGVWGAVLRFGGMPLEKIALFSNSSQVSGKGQLGQAVKLTFAEGMLAPFRVVGPASFVAWFLQYSVMGFVFQSCDRTLSKVMGVPNVYYGDELFEPGNRTPAANVRPAPARPLLTRAALPAAKKSETAVPVGDQAKSIAKAVAAPLLAGVVESAVSNRAEVQRYYGIEQFAKIESKLGWCVSPSAALCATGTPVQTPAARATQERHLAQHGPRFRRELVAQLCHVDHLVRAHADPVQAVLPAGAEVAGTRRRPVASLSLSLRASDCGLRTVDAILVRAGVQHLRRQRRSDHAASAVGPSPRLRRAERRPENQLPRCCQGGSGEGRLGGVFHAGEVVCPRPHERPRPRSARQHSMSCPGCQLQQYWLPTPGARTALDKMLLKQAPSRGSTTRSFPLPSRR